MKMIIIIIIIIKGITQTYFKGEKSLTYNTHKKNLSSNILLRR